LPSSDVHTLSENRDGGSVLDTAQALPAALALVGSAVQARVDSKAKVTPAEPTDEALFASATRGDQSSLVALIGRYEVKLFGLLVHLSGGDRNAADDFFQETFLRVMRSAATFDGQRSFRCWIMAIAVNLVRDEARKRKHHGEVGLQSPDQAGWIEQLNAGGASPAEQAERNDRQMQVRRALERLTLKERETVLLHFFTGMTLAEVAQSLDVPLGTVKSRLHGALERLKGILEP